MTHILFIADRFRYFRILSDHPLFLDFEELSEMTSLMMTHIDDDVISMT